MKTTTPIQDTLDRLAKLDDQMARGLIRKYDMDTQRLIALVDLLIATSDPE